MYTVLYTPEPEPEPEILDSLVSLLACMYMQVCLCVFSAGRQVYAGCFPGDKYAGRYGGRYAYVGSYAGIASMDVVVVCFERRVLLWRWMRWGRGGEVSGCLDVTLECTCILHVPLRWMMDDG